MHDRPAKYDGNHDGDSVTMVLDQGYFDAKTIHIRMANVWAPETHDRGGRDVQRYVENWFKAYALPDLKWPFIVYSDVTSTGAEKKTFDRFVATIKTADNQFCLNTEVMKYIIEKGYGGGVGAPW